MVNLTGDRKTLYDALQEKSRRELERVSGTEVILPDNPVLAKDIGSLPDDVVADLLRPFTSVGVVW